VRPLRAALAAALLLGTAAAAAPPALKDPQYEARAVAFRKALRPPPAKGEPGAPASERVAAVAALARTRDARVFEDLARSLSPLAREIEKAEAVLGEATKRLEQVRNAHFQQAEEEFRRTGKWPETILRSTQQALETLGAKQTEAAAAYDLLVRVRDAVAAGMGEHLLALGPDRQQVWKGAVTAATSSRDPGERAAFCEALRSIVGRDAEEALLGLESSDPDPQVVVAALGALAAQRSAPGLDRLLKRLEDPDWTVAAAAVRGVSRYRDPRVIPALVARLAKAERRIYSDVVDALFDLTGKHLPETADAWAGWWKAEGEKFLERWSPEKSKRLDEVERISLADTKTLDVAAELAALFETETDGEVRTEILGNISIHPSPSARVALVKALWDPSKEIRIAAVNYLANPAYRHVSVPGELMRRVDPADADEVRAIHRALRTLWTVPGGEQEFAAAAEKEALQRWWDQNRDRVAERFTRLGARDVAAGRRPRADDLEGTWRDRNFYGLKLVTDRVLFVVDCSLSMEEPAKKGERESKKKIEVAKSELTRAIRALEEGATFGILVFSATAELWETGMVPADAIAKKRAVEWVGALRTHQATNVYDALEAAFLLGTPRAPQAARRSAGSPDTIYLVSDGAPTVGKFTRGEVILEYVRRWNRNRGVKVDAIGVGEDQDVNFLRTLAEENGGVYVAR